jgi:hypothetical protein
VDIIWWALGRLLVYDDRLSAIGVVEVIDRCGERWCEGCREVGVMETSGNALRGAARQNSPDKYHAVPMKHQMNISARYTNSRPPVIGIERHE